MRNKKTKIVATISDLNCEPELIQSLYDAGMDVVRLNTAHQDFEGTKKVIDNVRKVSDSIALLLDTKGPEIRTTKVDEGINLTKGDKIKIKFGHEKTTPKTIYVSYSDFVKDLKKDSEVLIDDGIIKLHVVRKLKDHIECEVVDGGLLESKKTVNVPGTKLKLPSLSEKDKEYINFAIDNDLDFIAHSFVRSKKDIWEVQKLLDKKESKIKLISKVENQEGIDNIDEILDSSYGIMIARGDLGVEIPAENVPIIQKDIIERCISKAKPVITATQMMHNMIVNPSPTRAEVNDVANAIIDGTDAVMLSGETSKGKYPVESVTMMARIAKRTEETKKARTNLPVFKTKRVVTSYLVKSAVSAENEMPLKAVIIHTLVGHSARIASAYRGRVMVHAKCYDKKVSRELMLSYGINPSFMKHPESTDEMIKNSLNGLIKEEKLRKDDLIVILGRPPRQKRGTTIMEINTVENCLEQGY